MSWPNSAYNSLRPYLVLIFIRQFYACHCPMVRYCNVLFLACSQPNKNHVSKLGVCQSLRLSIYLSLLLTDSVRWLFKVVGKL